MALSVLQSQIDTLYRSFDNLRYKLVSGKLEKNIEKLCELKRYDNICNEIATKSLVTKEIYDLMMNNTIKIYQDSVLMTVIERNLYRDFVFTAKSAMDTFYELDWIGGTQEEKEFTKELRLFPVFSVVNGRSSEFGFKVGFFLLVKKPSIGPQATSQVNK